MWKTSLLLIAVMGCHSAMDDMNSMRAYIDDTRRETTQHLEAARAASTMQHMRDEMTRHRDGMKMMMVDMDVALESMTSHCDELGLGEMRAMHGELDGEMMQHVAAMDTSVDLAAAMDEVERHAVATMSMADGMGTAMGSVHCR
jgi:hypothetical protein